MMILENRKRLIYKREEVMVKITAEEIVRDLGEEPLSVPPDTTVYEAVKLMLEKDKHAVLVREGDKYVGIWTERDLSKNTVIEGFDAKTAKVGDYMSFPIISVSHTDNLFRIIDKALGHHVRHLAVEKDGKYIGLLHGGDVIRAGFTARTQELRDLNEMVDLEFYENWKWRKKNK
jgi:signal-transduction protein with cAMP-binding, CBS, and nucleotidyltransferase domain